MNESNPDKRYVCFSYDSYQSQGGLGDKIGSFDTKEEVVACYMNNRDDHFDVYDREDGIDLDVQEMWRELNS